MSEPYSLLFPFRTTNPIKAEESLPINAGALNASLYERFEFLVLEIKGFDSKSQASEFLPTAWASIMWASINEDMGIEADTSLSTPNYNEDPIQSGKNFALSSGLPEIDAQPIHGVVVGDNAVVIETNKKFGFISIKAPTVSVTHQAKRLVPHLEEGLQSSHIASFFNDKKLRLALDLWMNYHRESSLTAKFLTLVMILEVLSPPAPKHQFAQDLLTNWEKELDAKIAECNKDTEEFHALESLRRELFFRKEKSIRSRVRELVITHLTSLPENDMKDLTKQAIQAYDLRGELVHKGTLSSDKLNKGFIAAHNTVKKLLINGFGRNVKRGGR